MKARVLVGMSGGVDSSVTAALLKERGFEVVGAYMKNWTINVAGARCPWAEDLAYAKRTAVRLDIDFKVYDFQNEYKRDVVDYMIAEYQAGRTPNPDVICNQHVKFGLFLEAAEREGFDYIATGHYAQNEWNITSKKDKPTEPRHLFRAVDERKDQTYFLYRITQHALDKTLFPLGSFTKPQVREMAKERNLPSAEKPDSQGICFVGEAGIREFLRMYVEAEPGKIIDAATDTVLGCHDGAIFFTIGQRRGLNIGGGKPHFVVGKDMERNEVYVCDDPSVLRCDSAELSLARCSWIAQEPPAEGTYLVRTRHTGDLREAQLQVSGDSAVLSFSEPGERVAAGQSAVIYDGTLCLGGGIAT